MLRRRHILVPWLASTVVMFGLSFAWHGIALNDLRELKVPIALYLCLSALAYLIIGLGITVMIHQFIQHKWIVIKNGFPMMGLLAGIVVGFVVYLLAFIFGMSFADHRMMHVLVDVLWQMVEQGLGGLLVSLGIIYDMHQSFLEHERAR